MIHLLLLLLSAEPRFQGGVPPTAMNKQPAPVDSSTNYPCSEETLRSGATCTFDGKPAAGTNTVEQTNRNLEIAMKMGLRLCVQRAEANTLDPALRKQRAEACGNTLKRTLSSCGLEGKEALLDAEGRFGEAGKACYLELAVAAQQPEAPPQPIERPAQNEDAPRTRGAGTIKKI